jgi:hypothetical protein
MHHILNSIGNFIAKWIIIITVLSAMTIPIGIIRSTVFKDTLCIQILYSDGHEDYKFVSSSDYKHWKFNHDVLQTKFAGTLDSKDVKATTPIYNVFTGNNQ